MTLEIVQVGNRPSVRVSVKQPDGSARDLTGATNLKIKLRPEVQKSVNKTYTASVVGDPADGILTTDAVQATDLATIGVWKAQALFTLGGKDWHTHPEEIFELQENLA